MKRIIATIVVLACGLSIGRAQPAAQPASATQPSAETKNILFVGSSYIASAGSQRELVGAMLKSRNFPADCDQHTGAGMGCIYAWFHNLGQMTVDETKRKKDGKLGEADNLAKTIEGRKGKFTAKLKSRPVWDFIIIDTYGSTAAVDFPEAVAGFVKTIREHSPKCNIILYSVWPGKKGSAEQATDIFQKCVEQARLHKIWVATTGLALFGASVERPELPLHRSETDGHPGMYGGYINACSLFAIITSQSPVGLPSTLKIASTYDFPSKSQTERPKPGTPIDFTLPEKDARFLQEFAWKTYQCEIKNTKPAQNAPAK